MVWGQGRGIPLNPVVGIELDLLFGTVYASSVYLGCFNSICNKHVYMDKFCLLWYIGRYVHMYL